MRTDKKSFSRIFLVVASVVSELILAKFRGFGKEIPKQLIRVIPQSPFISPAHKNVSFPRVYPRTSPTPLELVTIA